MKAIIVGAGKLGTSLIKALLGGENEILVIDEKEDIIQKVKDRYDVQTVIGDAGRMSLLKDVDAGSYDLLAACTENDEENMIICRFAKDLGCGKTVARIRAPRNVDQVDYIRRVMGIDNTVNPDMSCAEEVFRRLTERYSMKGGRLISGKTAILECEIENLPELSEKELKDTAGLIPGVLVTAVSRSGRIIVPNGSTKLLPGDILYLTGKKDRINEILRRRHSRSTSAVKRVMIAGGGKTGFYLAEKLEKVGIGVRIIELSRSRCEYLANALENTIVIHGDATDKNLLMEENLEGMDAFVAFTGYDEENLLLSLIAKRSGVPYVITKMSHASYDDLVDTLGVDMVINPIELSAAGVLRYVEKEGIVVFSQIIQGQAEFVEIMAEQNMPLVGRELRELCIPEGVLIASVSRNGELITPGGLTVIQPGDQVTILSLLSSTASLEALIKR